MVDSFVCCVCVLFLDMNVSVCAWYVLIYILLSLLLLLLVTGVLGGAMFVPEMTSVHEKDTGYCGTTLIFDRPPHSRLVTKMCHLRN